MTDELKMTLADRGKTHGSFKDNASITTELRHMWRLTPNWGRLHDEQKLALDEIALKIARILSEGASPDYKEPWHDISGYGMLGEQACRIPAKPMLKRWGCNRCNFSVNVTALGTIVQCQCESQVDAFHPCGLHELKEIFDEPL